MANDSGNSTWENRPSTSTPLSAARMNNIEDALNALGTGKAAASHTHAVGDIDATGTADGTTYLRGDGTWSTPSGGGGVTDHGALTGLSDDDHTQYALADGTRGDFAATSHTHSVGDIDATGTADGTSYLRGDGVWAVPPGEPGAGGSQVDIYYAGGAPGSTSTYTWTKPDGAKTVFVRLIGPGAGGSSGRRGASGTNRGGGGGGGAGGITEMLFAASELPDTVTVKVGAGGAGGAGRTTDDTDGAEGQDFSSFTRFGDVHARNGTRGLPIASSTTGGNGGKGGPGGADSGSSGSNGGLTGDGSNVLYTNYTRSAQGGAGGGGVSSSDTPYRGGQGGKAWLTGGSEAAGGAAPGGDGEHGVSGAWVGGGGGGGGGHSAGPGGRGGDGAAYGGGGGGGGASVNGYASGAGGNGGDGLAVVVTWS